MDFTTDKLRSMVRKWQTLIEAHVDVKTTDGYLLRMFCIAFTKKRQQQVKKTCYAQTSQIRQIRRKMVELMTREAAACDLKELVGKFIPEAIGARRPSVLRPCNGLTCAQLAFFRFIALSFARSVSATGLKQQSALEWAILALISCHAACKCYYQTARSP